MFFEVKFFLWQSNNCFLKEYFLQCFFFKYLICKFVFKLKLQFFFIFENFDYCCNFLFTDCWMTVRMILCKLAENCAWKVEGKNNCTHCKQGVIKFNNNKSYQLGEFSCGNSFRLVIIVFVKFAFIWEKFLLN